MLCLIACGLEEEFGGPADIVGSLQIVSVDIVVDNLIMSYLAHIAE